MIEQDEAHALRRYVRNRAAGRPAPEFARFHPAIQGWVESNATEAAGRCDGKACRQVRRRAFRGASGLGWTPELHRTMPCRPT